MRAGGRRIVVLGFGVLVGYGGGWSPRDAGVDAGPVLEDLPVAEEVTVSGLGAPVDVVRDTRGIPHFYGQSLREVVRVQGALMACDRLP